MTENDWLASEDPAAMLRHLRGHEVNRLPISDRKLRLFACACVRQVWDMLTNPRSRDAVEVAERYADGEATAKELDVAEDAARSPWTGSENPAGAARYCCLENIQHAVERITSPGMRDLPSLAVMAALLRDIAGNPFRQPVVPHQWLPKDWLTPTALGLARAAYDERPGRECQDCLDKIRAAAADASRADHFAELMRRCLRCGGSVRLDDGTLDPARLAVLADALEEAGCGSEDQLMHLRRPGPHVRGCWAIDLILGKE
jgi:hypothetical protein